MDIYSKGMFMESGHTTIPVTKDLSCPLKSIRRLDCIIKKRCDKEKKIKKIII